MQSLAKPWSSYNARQGVWTYSGRKGLLAGAIGSDVIENAMWQLGVVWMKGKSKKQRCG